MKVYKKPEIEIVEFDVLENVTQELTIDPSFGGPALMNMQSDEIFYGADAGDQGYLINQ